MLIDLDGLCRADPAHDLGRFLATIKMMSMADVGLREHRAAIGEALVLAYGARLDDGALRDRVAFYGRSTLLRKACITARQDRARLSVSELVLAARTDEDFFA